VGGLTPGSALSQHVPTVIGVLDLLLPRRCVLCHTTGTPLCGPCATSLPPAPDLAAPPGYTSCSSLLRYEGTARSLIAALKYRGHRDAVGVLGASMAELVAHRIDLVTWAPTSALRRRGRGFDQSELLAGSVARSLGVRCQATLVRLGGRPQTGLGRSGRLEGPRFDRARSPGRALLVVDDVRTTGATLCAAADTLLAAGAVEVHGLTLAVTT
jgi:predicted amidophosphoribosyltransferase